LLLFFNAARLAEKQHIPVYSLWFDPIEANYYTIVVVLIHTSLTQSTGAKTVKKIIIDIFNFYDKSVKNDVNW
jgi:hypothetical protein